MGYDFVVEINVFVSYSAIVTQMKTQNTHQEGYEHVSSWPKSDSY